MAGNTVDKILWGNQAWGYIVNGPKNKTCTKDEIQKHITSNKLDFFERTTPAQTFGLIGFVAGVFLWLCGRNQSSGGLRTAGGLLAIIGLGATALFGALFRWPSKEAAKSQDEKRSPWKQEQLSKNIALLGKEKSKSTRINALKELMYAADKGASDAVAECLRDLDPEIQAQAAEALGCIHTKDYSKGNKNLFVVDKLIKCLSGNNPEVLKNTLLSLSWIGDPKAISHIERFLSSPIKGASAHAAIALENFYKDGNLSELPPVSRYVPYISNSDFNVWHRIGNVIIAAYEKTGDKKLLDSLIPIALTGVTFSKSPYGAQATIANIYKKKKDHYAIDKLIKAAKTVENNEKQERAVKALGVVYRNITSSLDKEESKVYKPISEALIRIVKDKSYRKEVRSASVYELRGIYEASKDKDAYKTLCGVACDVTIDDYTRSTLLLSFAYWYCDNKDEELFKILTKISKSSSQDERTQVLNYTATCFSTIYEKTKESRALLNLADLACSKTVDESTKMTARYNLSSLYKKTGDKVILDAISLRTNSGNDPTVRTNALNVLVEMAVEAREANIMRTTKELLYKTILNPQETPQFILGAQQGLASLYSATRDRSIFDSLLNRASTTQTEEKISKNIFKTFAHLYYATKEKEFAREIVFFACHPSKPVKARISAISVLPEIYRNAYVFSFLPDMNVRHLILDAIKKLEQNTNSEISTAAKAASEEMGSYTHSGWGTGGIFGETKEKKASRFYKVLDVPDGAPFATVHQAYHKLSGKYHKASQEGDDENKKKEATRKFTQVCEAYRWLRDNIYKDDWNKKDGDSPKSWNTSTSSEHKQNPPNETAYPSDSDRKNGDTDAAKPSRTIKLGGK